MRFLTHNIRRAAVLAIVSCLSACSAPIEESSTGPFLGTWVIDIDRSMKLARTESGHAEKSDVDLEDFFLSRMSGIQIEITASEMIFHFAEESRPYGYTPVASGARGVTVRAEWMGEQQDVVFTRLAQDELHIKFLGAHDFDYCVWRRQIKHM